MKYLALLLLTVALAAAFPAEGPTKRDEHSGRIFRFKAGREDRPLGWWESGLVYQIYPRSFQDSNGDGVGDLLGIIPRLDHFVNLGVNTLWLSPIFKSPMVDFGYDIADFIDIDPIFGNMADFEALVAAAHSKGLKIVLDMVPNHSSDQHQWFQDSINRVGDYADYYVWKPAKILEDGSRAPPNNWISVFGGPAWEWNEVRQEYYLHQFATGQPDLNYRNPRVVEEIKEVLRFWLRKGVDGFRVDAVPHVYEDPAYLDEPLSNDPNALPTDYGYLNHIYSWNLPEIYPLIGEMRAVLQEFEAVDQQHRILLTEAYVPLESIIQYYGNETNKLSDFPFNFALIKDIKSGFTAVELLNSITTYLVAVPSWAWPNWVIGNHDNNRVASRIGSELVDGVAMVQMLLGGTPVTYYGEEIGMIDTFISWEDSQDPQGCNVGPDRYLNFTRDPERTPMQWDATQNAGFSTAEKTWLPLNENYPTLNVEAASLAEESHLKVYQALLELRKTPTIQQGSLSVTALDEKVFAFSRIHEGTSDPGYLVVINVGSEDDVADLSLLGNIPAEVQVVVRSVGSAKEIGSSLQTAALPIAAKEGLVLSFTPVA